MTARGMSQALNGVISLTSIGWTVRSSITVSIATQHNLCTCNIGSFRRQTTPLLGTSKHRSINPKKLQGTSSKWRRIEIGKEHACHQACHLEHQFGATPCGACDPVSQGAYARRSVPAGNQGDRPAFPRRCLPAAWLYPSGDQRPEGLSRGGNPFPAA